jgi:hypothetical protein
MNMHEHAIISHPIHGPFNYNILELYHTSSNLRTIATNIHYFADDIPHSKFIFSHYPVRSLEGKPW